MHFTLVRFSTAHMPDTRVFDDVLLPLKYALQRLGYKAECRHNSFSDARNICLGANYDPMGKWIKLPPGSIVYNLEQLQAAGYPWLKDDAYLKLLSEFETWDFSRANIDYLAEKNITAAFLPIAFVPEMSRLLSNSETIYDALFYGAITPRRRKVLDELDAKSFNLLRLEKAFGYERDKALYQSSLLINIHHSLPASLEIVRLAYAFANKKAVVSELNHDTYHYNHLKEAALYGSVEELADLTAALALDKIAREKQAQLGFEAFSSLKLEDALADILGRRSVHGLGADFTKEIMHPEKLNIGSGLRFLDDAVNIDLKAECRPDLIMNFPKDYEAGKIYKTDRFANICLKPSSFQRIFWGSALAKSPEIDEALAVAHELLLEGGQLILSLPYDISGKNSEGERCFNGESFSFYINSGVFKLEKLEYLWSELGRVLEARGYDVKKRLKSAGAVDYIRLVLRKSSAAFIRAPKGYWPLFNQDFSSEDIAKPVFQEASSLADGGGELIGKKEFVGRVIYVGPVPLWVVVRPKDEAAYILKPPLPSLWKIRLKLMKLYFKNLRYAFNLKFKLAGRHDRYLEKLASVNLEIKEIKRLLALTEAQPKKASKPPS